MHIKYPFSIHFIHHISNKEAENYSKKFYKWICFDIENINSFSSGVPSFYWPLREPPNQNYINYAEKNYVIIFLDDEICISDSWISWLKTINNSQSTNTFYIPVSLTENFHRIDLPIQIVRAFQKEKHKLDYIKMMILNSISENISSAAPNFPNKKKIFISHAKKDGRNLALLLKDFIEEHPLKVYYDEVSIPTGINFKENLEDSLHNSMVIAILTDCFSSRIWCQWEILMAKKLNCPLILIDAFKKREGRHFPYASNAPLIRWGNNKINNEQIKLKIANEILKETIRVDFYNQNIQNIVQVKNFSRLYNVQIRPPELASMYDVNEDYVIYPDPPISKFEISMIEKTYSKNIFTPLQLLSENIDERTIIHGQKIAISISSINDCHNGILEDHVQNIFLKLVSSLFFIGAKIIYGGDISIKGYSTLLTDLARTYTSNLEPLAADAITNSIAWPLYLKLNTSFRASLPNCIKLEMIPAPDQVAKEKSNQYIDPNSPENIIIYTHSLRNMRKKVAEEAKVCILIGGQTKSLGLIPGLVEEFLTHVDHGNAVYLIGFYGGATQSIINMIQNQTDSILDDAFQLDTDHKRQALSKYNEENFIKICYSSLKEKINKIKLNQLNNGLNEDENRLLFTTPNTDQQVALVIKGLSKIFKNQSRDLGVGADPDGGAPVASASADVELHLVELVEARDEGLD
jgi:hypothetical protein